jgi:hypothetical protein
MSSKPQTLEHREKVIGFAKLIMGELTKNVLIHDESKMQEPELSIFDEYTPKLKTCTYGSDEYKGYLKEMGKALGHHYQVNRHHPEHFDNGIRGMNLVDLVEMFCDWWAASLRHNDGDIRTSIEMNQERFGYSDDIKAILLNTVSLFNL